MPTETFKVGSESAFSEKLALLNTKIDNVKKQITYLDVYNISDTVTDKNTFNAKVNALMNNSSLVINTTPFYINNQLYNTGDIILKDNYGNIIHIKAQTGGIFYPSKITKDVNNNYTIQYAFSQEQPSKEENSVTIDTETTIAKKIIFKDLKDDNTQNYVYGVWQKITENVFYIDIFKTKDDVSIQPYIKFFISSDGESGNLAEEIALDYKIEKDTQNNKWKITIDNNQFIVNNQLWVKVK